MEKRRNILFTIGIDKYDSESWRNLNNAVLDAKEIAQLLIERYSFELYPDSLFDSEATKKNIYASLNNLKFYVEPSDNLIIFFAGHGNMNPHTHRGYWVPYDGTLSLDTYIENSVIKDFIQDIDAQHIWLIADSCFSGTFLTRTRGVINEMPYHKLDEKKSRWMFASGSEEKVSDGQEGLHSPFSRYIIRFLQENTNIYTCVSEIIKYVTQLTINNSTQTPRGAFIDNIGHQDGEMIFVLKENLIKHNFLKTRGTTNTPKLRLELRANQKGKQNPPSTEKQKGKQDNPPVEKPKESPTPPPTPTPRGGDVQPKPTPPPPSPRPQPTPRPQPPRPHPMPRPRPR